MNRWTVTTGAWILAGFLLITIALILAAREEDVNFPSVTNTHASGFAAFAELLRRDGYNVVLDTSVKPKFEKNDLVFVTSFDYGVFETTATSPIEQEATWEKNPYENLVSDHLRAGGHVIEVFNQQAFKSASDLAKNARLAEPAHDRSSGLKVSVPYGTRSETSFDIKTTPYDSWIVDDSAFVSVYRVGNGLLTSVADGILMSNRFLDEQDNAVFALTLVRSMAPQGARVVFVEAGIGNADQPSPTNTLGNWAVAARWQAIILFGVLVFTLGRRFGLPTAERRRVRGTRELFDAVADVFRRTGNTGLALDNLLMETESRVRKTLNASPSMPRQQLLAQVPPALKDQFFKVAELASIGARPADASREAAKLVAYLEGFVKDSRAARGLKR